jgi:hypothetical protein
VSASGASSATVRSLAWPLAAGAVVFVAGTLLGWDAGLPTRLVTLPALARAVLVAVATLVALALLREALVRLEGSVDERGHDLVAMVRGIRFVFLAVAAFSAAAGWLLAHPLPLVVALIVAGVDVLETSFLLVVVSVRGRE